ncbi:MAG TPA: PilZ domain-containing protein [Stenotrophobium sp.]|nr:PilZ domain-containing protein [Stenotrophobium sp.]
MPETPPVLQYSDRVPMRWSVLAEPPSVAELERMAATNIHLLNAISALEEHRELPAEENVLAQEVNHLHRKVDLLLGLVARLVEAQLPPPPAVAVVFSSEGMSWAVGPQRPPVGSRILLEVYLSRGAAEPLRLPAIVEAGTADSVQVRFDLPVEGFISAIEQHVFLRHRRSVAKSLQSARVSG